ncbi:hypothetical protein A8708_26125 [Paenibacillus oryzisoli]|uniref:Uncharacterized protein n=1 Tax=Paenibacillus oryzisoli TaxID=1850517 RepID=A0A198AFJ0_9BACL|nr:hypothetical protein A8708_26125 [Paenibacillus oryzisoli]
MGIPLVGALMGSMLFAVVHIILHLVLYGLCYRNMINSKISINEFFVRRDSWIFNTIRGVGYVFIVVWGYDFIRQYFKFYVFNVLFYLSVAIVIYMYTVWVLIILKRPHERKCCI